MKKTLKKIRNILFFKKKEPWYKRWWKQTVCILDMKRKNKFIVFFGLLFIALYVTFPPLESIVKQAVHEYGSKVTKTDVAIEGLKFKPTSGYVAVKGVKIGNPDGYKSKSLFYLNKLIVQIDISTITDDIIIVDFIKLNKPQITYEMLSLNKNNISDILENIKQNSASAKPNKIETKQQSKSNNATSKKVIIKNLIVNNGYINVMTGIGDFKKELSLPLPTIEMHNIGEEAQGSSVKDTINFIITKILNSATDIVVSQNLDNIKETAAKELKNLKSELKDDANIAKNKLKNNLKNLISF